MDPQLNQPMNSGKPGHKTSEFWMIAVVGILIFFGNKLGVDLESTQEQMVGAMAVLYAASRSFVKGISK